MSRGRRISRLRLEIPTKPQSQKYLLEWSAKELFDQSIPLPKLTSAELFKNNNQLQIEIGPGTGEFLCDIAEKNPEINYVGIEASRKAAYYCVRLAAKKNIPNVKVIKANFKLLESLLVPDTWTKVYLHFPDPILKRKDMKHRIFDKNFLTLMVDILQKSGEISVVSDNQPFFDEMLNIADQHSEFHFANPANQWQHYESDVKSRFQSFWESKGVRPRQFQIIKNT
jgi:tRNA (guanine-N7-)-methyltransferase